MRISCGLVVVVLFACSPAPEVAVTECDLLAAHPHDPRSVADGVEDAEIDINQAMKVCDAAISDHPGVARFEYQKGRVLSLAGDGERAFRWFLSAADSEYPFALYEVGERYISPGTHLPAAPEKEEIALMFLTAAEEGVPQAFAKAAMLYATGFAINQDIAKAIEFAERSIRFGDFEGHFVLGVIHSKVAMVSYENSKESFRLAIQHLRIASDASVPQAKTILAFTMMGDVSSDHTRDEMISLLEEDARLGVRQAAFWLSKIYAEGLLGRAPSPELSEYWQNVLDGISKEDFVSLTRDDF